MKLVAGRDALKDAVGLAASVLTQRLQQTEWRGFVKVLDTGDIIGTNGELVLATPIRGGEITVSDHGMLIPAQPLMKLLGAIPPGLVTLRTLPGGPPHHQPRLIVEWELSSIELSVVPAADYPVAKPSEFHQGFRVKAGKLKTALQRVEFCSDRESSRYALQGVLLELDGKSGFVVATDTRRLALHSLPVDGGAMPTPLKGILPELAVDAIIDAIDEPDAEVSVAGDESRFEFQIGARRICGPFLLGRFPDWRSIMPKEVNHQVTILASMGRRLLRQALTMTNDDHAVQFLFSEQQAVITAETADVGNMRAEASTTLTGAPCIVKYDGKYLLDFFQRCDDEAMVRWEFKDQENATVVSLMSDEWQYLVMPMGGV